MGIIHTQGLPESLNYLAGLDKIIIKQKIELLEGEYPNKSLDFFVMLIYLYTCQYNGALGVVEKT